MVKLDEHPTVIRHRQVGEDVSARDAWTLSGSARLCLDAGADDVGFVSIERRELDDQRADILAALSLDQGADQHRLPDEPRADPQPGPLGRQPGVPPHRRTGPTRSPARSSPPSRPRGSGRSTRRWASRWRWTGFPGKIWVVAHKPVAVAAGLGQMGIHRNVIHPKFGNFILLATILVDAEISEEDSGPSTTTRAWSASSAWPPAPWGRSAPTGISTSRRATRTTTASSWAGSATGWSRSPTAGTPATIAAGSATPRPPRCGRAWASGRTTRRRTAWRSARPGEDVIGPFLATGRTFLEGVVNPLQEKEETLYVVPGSDAEDHAAKRFPHKTIKRVGNGLRPSSIAAS